MDARTGELIEAQELAKLLSRMPDERRHFIPVERPLTKRELNRMRIDKYAPCGCGSGKKFKFCCYKP